MAVQPTYPHDIVKTYVWWVDRRQIAIAYHDLDDGNSGYNGEFISPIVGYDAKLVDTSIAFNDGGGGGGTDLITDANNNFLNAGFEALQEMTASLRMTPQKPHRLRARGVGNLVVADAEVLDRLQLAKVADQDDGEVPEVVFVRVPSVFAEDAAFRLL